MYDLVSTLEDFPIGIHICVFIKDKHLRGYLYRRACRAIY